MYKQGCPAPDTHVSSWPNHTKVFGDAERTVVLTFGRWGPDEMRVVLLTVGLGGSVFEPLTRPMKEKPLAVVAERVEEKAVWKGETSEHTDSSSSKSRKFWAKATCRR